MKYVIYNQLMNKDYLGIITILDYEISVRKSLEKLLVSTQNRTERKIIVDLALKVGINEYRFVEFDISDEGKILWKSNKYVTPCNDIVTCANSIITKKGDLLANSMLPNSVKETLFHN